MDVTRKCWKCGEGLPLTADNFYRNINKKDGWGTECKSCHKQGSQSRRTNRRKSFIESKGNRCNGCGLEHKDFKFFDIDHIIPLEELKEPRRFIHNEENLQVLCPNCHREKTMRDRNWGKYE